jgi:hypothetical protein
VPCRPVIAGWKSWFVSMTGSVRKFLAGRSVGFASRTGIALLCLGIFLVLRVLNPLPAERFRDSAIGKIIDVVSGIVDTEKTALQPGVFFVDIDEATIAKYGRWPLPRRDLARLLGSVMAGKPAVVGFAYVFLPASGDVAGDRVLAASLRAGPVVLGMAQFRPR